MNNKQKLLTATAITGTIVSASAFTVFDYAICRRKKQPDVRKKEKWKPYLDYVLKEQEWLKEHQEQELKEIRSKDGLTLRAAYIPRENAKERFHLPPFPLMYMVDLISEVVAGFGLKEVSIPEIMKRNKIPVLFIHGDADDYVPMWMTIKNYEACAAKKELYIVSGAGHALAFSKDMEEGKRRIKNFINKYKTI